VHPAERASPDPLTLLGTGDIEVRGRLPWSSNGTFLVDVGLDGTTAAAVYKPLRGERPLWDYPPGLYRREVAAWVVSEALGWGLVPETVQREGPLGPGSLQRFVDADFSEHYFSLLERPEHHDVLKAICVFDVLINNGDRKSGHCIVDGDGRIWGIDHGLCLAPDNRLRTVIWDFGGDPIAPARLEAVARLAASPPAALAGLVDDVEVEALAERAATLVRRPVLPRARSGRAYPWPLI